ncbi:P-loop containing nucleoside triphosphate hydrolase protein [Marasmius fiardii PR-910]|nr:P-loop containing nucleoside triphosphate hydrolase protein [Marasmius fiardii PR-910]
MDIPLQQVLSGILKMTDASGINATEILSSILNATSPTNNTEGATSTSSLFDGSMPGNILAIFPFLFSFSALRDWVKIFLIGGLFETCRRWFGYVYEKVVDSFYMTAVFDQDDVSYQWMMVWLSTQPAWAKIRQVEVSTDTYGADRTAISIDDEDDEDAVQTRKMFYIPTPSKTYTLWYKGRYLTITRSEEQNRWGKDSKLHLTLMTRDPKLLAELLKEARRAYMVGQENKMCIWTADSANNWRQVARREKRSLGSIVLDPGVKDLIVEDARDFLSSRKWYTERGIPFRRGYLLYGAPGSGKTSLIHSLAGELELDVFIISLSRIGLDDSGLDTLINDLPERCVALMEDIDAAFTHGLTRELDEKVEEKRLGDKKDEDSEDERNDKKQSQMPVATSSRVSLSGLLNALDGIGAQEGRILFATTNKYSSLDPALCRPGRMDLHIEFKLASKYQARELFKRFYNPNDDAHDEEEEEREQKKEKKEKSKGEKVEDNEKHSSEPDRDSGYDSANESTSSSSSPLLPSPSPSGSVDSSKAAVFGVVHQGRHTHGPKVAKPQLEQMANEFAEAIPEREVSMAGLQGYLMTYKVRPVDAMKNVGEWVELELRAKREKVRRKEERRKREEEKRKVEKEKKLESKEEVGQSEVETADPS